MTREKIEEINSLKRRSEERATSSRKRSKSTSRNGLFNRVLFQFGWTY